MIRCIGRERSESSPVNVDLKFCPARIPASKRIVVPLLPQSSAVAGALIPPSPTPVIAKALWSCSIETPNALKHDTVAAQSALLEKLVIEEVPSASAANIAARCEIDLSPGNRTSPRIFLAPRMITTKS